MTDEILKVELVSQWWDDPLPVLAVLISVLTFAWTMWDKRADRARLKVSAMASYIVSGRRPNELPLVSVEVTNVGRAGTTVVHDIALELPDGGRLNSFKSPVPRPELPKRLESGESAILAFYAAGVAEKLLERNVQPERLKTYVRSGHGEVRGRISASAADAIQRQMTEQVEEARAEANTEPDELLDGEGL